MVQFIQSEIVINSSPDKILNALLEFDHLREWWGVDKCFIEKKDGGLYTLAWMPTEDGYKYVSTGQIKVYAKKSHLHLEKMLYLNYLKPILGPFTITYDLEKSKDKTKLIVKQNGFKKEPDYQWLYEVSKDGWSESLILLKSYLEKSS